MKLEKKKIKIFSVLLILILIVFCLFKIVKFKGNTLEDYLILKFLYPNIEENNLKHKDNLYYFFDMSYVKNQSKEINLIDTIKNIYSEEKLMPGVSGVFEVNLYSNFKTNYIFTFEDISNKPQNLEMYIDGTKIENDTFKIMGNLNKNQNKIITFYWVWNYEKNAEMDEIDTKEGTNGLKYIFRISAVGEGDEK